MAREPIQIDVRRAEPADLPAIARLLSAVLWEHVFLRRTIDGEESALGWLRDTPAVWSTACAAGETVGAVGVVFREGWSAHVAELRLVVAPGHRAKGVGAALALAGLTCAVELGALVVDVEALAEQEGVIGLFTRLGFVPAALLADHVRDSTGHLHDLVILSRSTVDVAASMATVGADEAIR